LEVISNQLRKFGELDFRNTLLWRRRKSGRPGFLVLPQKHCRQCSTTNLIRMAR